MVTVLALLMVLVLTTLAVALTTSSNMSLQQSRNIASAESAQLQAESGLRFMIYQLNNLHVASSTDANALLSSVAETLTERLAGSASLGGAAITYDPNDPAEPNTIAIPSISAGDAGSFSATITALAADHLRLLVTAQCRGISRTVGVDFQAVGGGQPTFFLPYGIVSRGQIRATGNVKLISTGDPLDASMMSATYSQTEAIDVTGNVNVAGDLYVSNPDGEVSLTGNCTIGGESGQGADDHIHIGVGEPEIPEVDPEPFRHLATNVLTPQTPTSGIRTFENLYVPAGLNPTFSGNIKINGIIFIEQPNKVHFSGNTTVTGIIVTEDAGDDAWQDNEIKFTGNTRFKDVSQLPDQPQFAELKQMPGSCILAPGFSLQMSGNFGTLVGWIAADHFKFTGNVSGTIQGGIINYGDTQLKFTGNTRLTFDRTEGSQHPPGLVMPPSDPVLQLQSDSYAEYR
ncbi:MAG: hypothetical protein J7M21_03670 [Planctomycetes bacterium]|nr:hypothetical protein [Planctomycetota bacterium]